MDGPNLALHEALSGDLGWRSNFLPAGAPLTEMLTLTGIALLTVAVVVALRGRRPERLIFVATVVAGLLMTVAVSGPLWHLPGMAYLQFPWRFLGPTTIIALLAVDRLAPRWQWLAVGFMVLPSAVVPFRLESQNARFPVSAPPAELARLAEAAWGLPPILPSARGFYAPGFDRLASLHELRTQPVTLTETTRTVLMGEWKVSTDSPTQVLLPVQWWPEWSVTVDGVEAPFVNRSGLVALECGGGVSIVCATLHASRSQALGLLLSIVGVLVVGWLAKKEVPS
jgi:hypothetical protein